MGDLDSTTTTELESEREDQVHKLGTFVCSNCFATFDLENRVAAFELENKISGGTRQITVMDALATTFNIKVDQSLLSSASMCLNLEICLQCANYLAGLYRNYQEFFQRSAIKSEVYELIKLSLQGEVHLTAAQINSIFARYIDAEAGPSLPEVVKVKSPVVGQPMLSTPDSQNTRISERLLGKRGRPRNHSYFTDEYVTPSPRAKHRKLTADPSVLSQSLPNQALFEEPSDLDKMKASMLGLGLDQVNPRALTNQLTHAQLKKKVAYKQDGTTSKNLIKGLTQVSPGKSHVSPSGFGTQKLPRTMIKKKVAYKSDALNNIITPTRVSNGIPSPGRKTPSNNLSLRIMNRRSGRNPPGGVTGRKLLIGLSPTGTVSNGKIGRGISKGKTLSPNYRSPRKVALYSPDRDPNSLATVNGEISAFSSAKNSSVNEITTTAIRKRGRPKKMLRNSPPRKPIVDGGVNGNGILSHRGKKPRNDFAHTDIPAPTDSISEVERTFQGFNCLNCGVVDPKREKMVIHLVEVHLLTGEAANSACDRATENYLERQKREQLRMVQNGQPKKNTPASVSYQTSTVCGECNKKFKTTDALQTHKKKAHKHLKPFFCTFTGCEMTFALKHSLAQHLKTHTITETHTPTAKPNLLNRSTGHTYSASKVKATLPKKQVELKMEKPYKCNLCSRSYKTSYLMNQHRLRHLDERTFPCDMCEKAFNTKSNLRKHKVTHISRIAGAVKCPVCLMLFPLKSLMVSHMVTTHKLKFPLRAEKAHGKSTSVTVTPETPIPEVENVNDSNLVLAVKSKPPPIE